MSEDKVVIDIVQGVEGKSVYINEYRVCGNKPWGGGRVLESFVTTREDIKKALGEK